MITLNEEEDELTDKRVKVYIDSTANNELKSLTRLIKDSKKSQYRQGRGSDGLSDLHSRMNSNSPDKLPTKASLMLDTATLPHEVLSQMRHSEKRTGDNNQTTTMIYSQNFERQFPGGMTTTLDNQPPLLQHISRGHHNPSSSKKSQSLLKTANKVLEEILNEGGAAGQVSGASGVPVGHQSQPINSE